MLNYWNAGWGLELDLCPCDVHLTDWLGEQGTRDATIYHFGTGTHHHVGRTVHAAGLGNRVFAITASPQEYEAYVKAAIEVPTLGRDYLAYFGDIYLANPNLLPDFDVVALFHLCEFRTDKNDAYGALTDLDLMLLFADKLRPGGHLLFYMRSDGFARTETLLPQFEDLRPQVQPIGTYKTLLVYRKQP